MHNFWIIIWERYIIPYTKIMRPCRFRYDDVISSSFFNNDMLDSYSIFIHLYEVVYKIRLTALATHFLNCESTNFAPSSITTQSITRGTYLFQRVGEVYNFIRAVLIAVLGRMQHACRGLDSPALYIIFRVFSPSSEVYTKDCILYKLLKTRNIYRVSIKLKLYFNFYFVKHH